MTPVYYNEIDPTAAAWLRELIAEGLIPKGEVDTRSIRDVQPGDLDGFTQCHFFAGIGGWSLALCLAGWPEDRPVWTGSCPCQPFSCAGKQQGAADDRNLWPAFMRLIRERKPECIFGEQVEAALRINWFDRVSADLEAEAYTVGAVVLGAHSVNAPHIRQRLWWVADGSGQRLEGSARESIQGRGGRSSDDCADGVLQREQGSGLGDTHESGLQGRRVGRDGDGERLTGPDGLGFWSNSIWHPCRDGKNRRIPRPQSGVFGVADGVREEMDLGWLESGFPLAKKIKGRAALLRGYGNAIVLQVAAEFVKAFLQTQQPEI